MSALLVKCRPREHRRAFTIPEVLVGILIGLPVAGTVVFLLLQAGSEQLRGLAGTTVEQSAYRLQANISGCMRGVSCTQGLTPDHTSQLTDGNGNLLGYQKVFVFRPKPDGTYTTEQIRFDSTTGRVVYIPDMSAPTNQVLWMTNSPSVALRQLCFTPSYNPDGSLNSSLVNVRFQMDDNGCSRHSPTNNPANIYRSFAIQMRSD